MIHPDECIALIEKIIPLNIWGDTFTACTDSHPTRREYYTQESLKLSYTVPKFDEKSKNEYKIISNQKLKEALNYQFIHTELMMKL
jgi:hypothetical protein